MAISPLKYLRVHQLGFAIARTLVLQEQLFQAVHQELIRHLADTKLEDARGVDLVQQYATCVLNASSPAAASVSMFSAANKVFLPLLRMDPTWWTAMRATLSAA